MPSPQKHQRQAASHQYKAEEKKDSGGQNADDLHGRGPAADGAAPETADQDRDPEQGGQELRSAGCQNSALFIISDHPSHDGGLNALVEEHDADGIPVGTFLEESEGILL